MQVYRYQQYRKRINKYSKQNDFLKGKIRVQYEEKQRRKINRKTRNSNLKRR